ncbi:MAG: chromosome segregation ATPase [Rapeseed phyllody phytoplasma]|uniref:Chromosome segregation ATPase n=2 Tax=16SrI (Aster yellows group) TaxID=3042590 RepID=A0A859I8S4_9MOLU|nr:MAG: chromosome segregation ATPase [Rapeseed phyllody phytoplasma]
MQQEQLQQTPPLGEELKETNQTTETQQLTPEEIIKAKNLLEIQLQQEKINSLALETQKANLEHDLTQKQEELENNQKLSQQEKQELQKEINQQTDKIRSKENEIFTQDQKINQLETDLHQEKKINTEKEKQINELINQINEQNQMTEQLQNQLQEQKTLIETKNKELINNQALSEQEKQALQQEINQLTTNFQQKEKEYQATIYQKDQEITHLNQIINEQANEINRLSEELEQQIDKWVKQGLHIEALEGTIKALENASSRYIEENAELRHEINKLKEQIKDEQKAHEATKVKLKEEENKLIEKTKKFDELDENFKNQKITYSAAIQPLKTVFKEDVRQRIRGAKENVEKVTSWFKKWF